jgi:Uma2 family endonuclease
MEPPKHKEIYTIAEYLQLEGDIRYEYHDGVLVNMSGGTVNHGLISVNVSTLLRVGLRGQNCRVLSSDVKVRVESANSFFFPDVSVVCGDVETSANDENSVTNPILLVEVLSESTKDYDLGTKFIYYSTLDSLREYICISQSETLVQRFFLPEDGTWRTESIRDPEKVIRLDALDLDLKVADFYEMII